MAIITAAQLVKSFQRYCNEKWGYVWGLNGELYTQAMADKFKKAKRSTNKSRHWSTYWTEDCKKWIGRMAADCSGGIVSAIREVNPKYGDRSANTFKGQFTKTGPIKTIPEVPGLGLWRDGHIGVYEGNGYALEFRGTDYGCVRTKLSQRDFTHWGYLADVDYGEAPKTTVEVIGGSVNIRAKADVLSSPVDLAHKGDRFKLVAKVGSFYQIGDARYISAKPQYTRLV